MKWRKVLVVLLLGVFLYSSYQIFSYLYVSHKEKSTYDQIRELYAEELKYENQFAKAAPSANLRRKLISLAKEASLKGMRRCLKSIQIWLAGFQCLIQ